MAVARPHRKRRRAGPRRTVKAAFRPRARLLRLLGDQLIRDQRIAVFELLKNAYDADAVEATVTIRNVESPGAASIVVEDDGAGMTFETVRDVWLEPGTDHRERQKSAGRRSPRFGRLPMGEKGIGRFAAHKLGEEIELVTRAEDAGEVVVSIDWDELEREDYLSGAAVRVTEREPVVFAGRTGTRIEIGRLRESWKRGAVRALRRSVTAMTSPFEEVASFRPRLELDPDPGWFGSLLDPGKAIAAAPFHAVLHVDPVSWTVSYDYRFSLPGGGRRVEPRKVSRDGVPLGNIDESLRESKYLGALERDAGEARADGARGIGPFRMDLHVFDLDRDTRLAMTDYRGVKDFLDANGGVRVYRDGIRVYDYGEPDNDWLGFDARRVNVPGRRISKNLVVGAVHLDSGGSGGLVEKTNREGFVESPSYRLFRTAVQSAVQHVVFERNVDKEGLRATAGKRRSAEPVADDLRRLRVRVRRSGLLDELGPYIDRAEASYLEFREILLTSAGAGLTMTVVVHEVEKGVASLNRALERKAGRERLEEMGRHLSEVTDALGFVAHRSDRTTEKASDLVAAALRTIDYRFAHHGIRVTNGFGEAGDFSVKARRRLIVGTLLNLFDNSAHWLGAKNPPVKRVYAGPAHELEGGPGILVADNGPGFIDPPEFLTRPFMSRKDDGTGLGLYIADEVMKSHGGRLVFPDRGDVALPRGYSGAAVVLQFGNAETGK